MLEDMRGLLQAADEKKQAALAELSAKHQKVHAFFFLFGEYLVSVFLISLFRRIPYPLASRLFFSLIRLLLLLKKKKIVFCTVNFCIWLCFGFN